MRSGIIHLEHYVLTFYLTILQVLAAISRVYGFHWGMNHHVLWGDMATTKKYHSVLLLWESELSHDKKQRGDDNTGPFECLSIIVK